MKAPRFDLELSEADVAALRAADRRGSPLDGETALKFIAQASARVDEAVRRRPLFAGAPFELPGLGEERTEAASGKEAGAPDRR